MTRIERMDLIKKLEVKLDTRILTYLTGDREGLSTKIGGDNVPMFHEHLSGIGKREKIALFLYSLGGDINSGFALTNLIREFCDKLCVIVPFRALSTATLICLGANEIIMSAMSQLGPIDPSVTHPQGPTISTPNGVLPIPVNVEDVNGYVDLAKNEFGLASEESMRRVFELLSSVINPVVLGAVQRSREQIAFLASSLMERHYHDKKEVDNIVGVLTKERFSHHYIIGRKEAKELGLKIIDTDEETLGLILSLFDGYKDTMELTNPLNIETLMSNKNKGVFTFHQAFIESLGLSHVYRTRQEIQKQQVPGQYKFSVLEQGWTKNEGV